MIVLPPPARTHVRGAQPRRGDGFTMIELDVVPHIGQAG
jgi:hypothetical protein